MAEFRFGRVRFEMALRTQRGTELSASELSELEAELRRELEDPMRARGMARFLDATVFFGADHVLELIMEKLYEGRIIVEREPEPEIDPGAGLDPLTLARLGAGDDDDDDEHYSVAIVLVGEDDEPIVGERYRVKVPGGKAIEGKTDHDGRAFLWGLARAGDCEIEFPDLDADAWEPLSSAPL